MATPRNPALALDAETLLAHSAWLAKFARALVANETELDDVLQQTYVHALAQPPQHTGNLRGWLGTIARNVVRSRARSDTARLAREVALPPPQSVETPDQAVERAELRRLVVEAVLALDEPYRSTLILRFFEEQDVATVARLTRSNEDTVRTRLRRGVARVRELLERRVSDDARDAEDGGAAACALLAVQLRQIAAGAGRAAGAGSGGALAGSAARRLAGAGGRSLVTTATRRVATAAAAVVVATGGWWWWNESRREPARSERSLAARSESGPGAPPLVVASAPTVAAERSSDPVGAKPPDPTPSPARRTKCGVIRGLVTAPDGSPVAGAEVWAIMAVAHDNEVSMPDFAQTARLQAEKEPAKLDGRGWVEGRTGEDGRYEFRDLSIVPGWLIGAYEPTLGAMVSEVHDLDREHRERSVDVRLMPGSHLRGSVLDEDGAPVGGARVYFFMTCAKPVQRTSRVTDSAGPHVGEFDYGFASGELVEVGCATPGFLPTPHIRVEMTPHSKETVVSIPLKRKPGLLLRGRIVDPKGKRVDVRSLLEAHFASDELNWIDLEATVWAFANGVKPPRALEANQKTGPGIVEGRIDFAESRYEFVVPEGFHGSIELRLFGVTVGSAPLDDPHDPPVLECDEARLPAESLVRDFAVRFVDADTKEPIDLAREDILPRATNEVASLQILPPKSDPKRGLVTYRCAPGFLKLEPIIHGYAMNLSFATVPTGPQASPMIVEIPPAKAGVHGFAMHADGRPFATTRISVFRSTPSGWVDATGPPTFTNPDGEFEFDGLGTGEYVAVVSGRPDEAPAVTRFVATDPFPEIELRSSVGREIRLRIAAPSKAGPRAKSQELQVLDRTGLLIEYVPSDWESPAKAPDEVVLRLDDGHYTLVVDRTGFRDARLEFDVPRETLDLPLEPLDSDSK